MGRPTPERGVYRNLGCDPGADGRDLRRNEGAVMTTQELATAQRVIDRLAKLEARTRSSSAARWGALEMHRELSKEARVIIGGIRKWRASLEGQEGFDASREALDDDIAQLVRFSHRLGLDLESEDE